MAPLILIVLQLAVDGGQLDAREERLAALRARAQERLEEDRLVYSDEQLRDIESRYRSAHREAVPMFLAPDGVPILLELAAKYPKSTRAGCAVLVVAHSPPLPHLSSPRAM